MACTRLCHDRRNTRDPSKVVAAHREKDPASPQGRLALTAAALPANVSKLCREVLARPCSVLCQ
jgi:hypothetical protein